ncbi:MAG: glycoside hydrolase family 15 protein, partial [Candidatus Thermoplasmatota archaeon]|nr:glycoside hydrolase family 15 protein [Candidatus Thermoplasmatota archaeon]
GNKASEQLQIDQYASIINAIDALSKVGGIISSSLWNFVGDTLDTLSELWAFPDSSIWEFRSEPRHYVYSKVLAWSAFQNAIDMGKRENLSGPYRKWTAIAEEIKADVLKNGFNKEVNSFVQYYGASETDAALLRIPLVNFLPITDRRIQGTVRKIENDLRVTDHLFKRYKNDDGLKGNDNAFLLLSFWYVEVLVKMGKINEARDVFDSLMDRANHLGLFSEEIDLTTGEQLGNFPQAMTHLGVIRSAVILNAAFRNSKKINGKIQLRAPIE